MSSSQAHTFRREDQKLSHTRMCTSLKVGTEMLNKLPTVDVEMRMTLHEYVPQPFPGPSLCDLLFREHTCSLVQRSSHARIQTLRKDYDAVL